MRNQATSVNISKWVDNFTNDFIVSKVHINVKLCKYMRQ